MRFLTVLFIALFVVSCGNQKLRFVRTDRVKQQVVELEEISTMKKERTETIATELPEISNPSEVSEAISVEVVDQSDEKIEMIPSANILETTDFPSVEEDSVNITPEEVAQIEEEALRSQKHGKWSFMFSLMTYLFLVLGIVSIVILSNLAFFPPSPHIILLTASILFGALFLGSLISSFVLGIKSLRARYTTRKGKKLAIAGLILSGIMVLLWLVNLAFSF